MSRNLSEYKALLDRKEWKTLEIWFGQTIEFLSDHEYVSIREYLPESSGNLLANNIYLTIINEGN